MKKIYSLLLGLCCFPLMGAAQTTYYVDAVKGKNTQDGLSPSTALKTLKEASALKLTPGDSLLLKSGQTFKGQLVLQGQGNKEQPIVVSKYGGETKPIIAAEGKYNAGVYLKNVSYYTIENLAISNMGQERKAKRYGVFLYLENYGVAKNITIQNLYVYDVNGSLIKKQGGTGAIHTVCAKGRVKSRFDNLVIQHNHIYNCGRNGIWLRGNTNREQWNPSTGVRIAYNLMEQVPGDGIVIIGTDGAVVEYNTMKDSPDVMPVQDAAAGIWPWSADNTLIQFNEVSGHKAKWDGQGFDSDWNCKNTTIQYNYSHDNYGGFLLVCNNGSSINTPGNSGTINTQVRFNVSINDGIRPYPTRQKGVFSPTFHISGPCNKTYIQRNLFIVPKKADKNIDHTFIKYDNWGGPWPSNTYFMNNIIVAKTELDVLLGKEKNSIYSNNQILNKTVGLPRQTTTQIEIPTPDPEAIEIMIERFFKDNKKVQKYLREL